MKPRHSTPKSAWIPAMSGKLSVRKTYYILFGDTSASVSCYIGRKQDFQTVLVLRSSCGLVGNGSKFWREKSLELRANLGRGNNNFEKYYSEQIFERDSRD